MTTRVEVPGPAFWASVDDWNTIDLMFSVGLFAFFYTIFLTKDFENRPGSMPRRDQPPTPSATAKHIPSPAAASSPPLPLLSSCGIIVVLCRKYAYGLNYALASGQRKT